MKVEIIDLFVGEKGGLCKRMHVYTAIVLFEESKCVDIIFTSDKRSLTVYNI